MSGYNNSLRGGLGGGGLGGGNGLQQQRSTLGQLGNGQQGMQQQGMGAGRPLGGGSLGLGGGLKTQGGLNSMQRGGLGTGVQVSIQF